MSEKLAWAQNWLKSSKTSFVAGAWIKGEGQTYESVDPSTEARLGTFSGATPAQVDAAVRAAQNAFARSAQTRADRGAMLFKIAALIREHAEELATLETLDNGKLYREALLDDVPEAASVFEYYAGWIDKFYGETCPVEAGFLNYTLNEPVGVCALIVPWNFPLLLACWKIAPALAMGNTVLVKPSPYTSFSMIRLFELIAEKLHLEPGVMNLVLGDAEVGNQLTQHPGIHKVSFTGSTKVGKQIVKNAAESNLKTVTLELGGKSPNIIFDDVPNIDFAMQRSFTATFSHKGEKCSEPTRLFVHRKHYARFLEYLQSAADAVVCGLPFAEASTQGAQCNRDQFDKILNYIDIGRSEGAQLVAGGHADQSQSGGKGYFVRPTVFKDVDNKMRIAQEEIFGPVLCVIPFESEDEVVAMANDSIYGLAAGLWTSDISRAHRVASRLDAGMVFINRYGCYDFSSPFGGFKQSGWGKEMALHSLKAYTKVKSIWVKL